jgi:hypothetical protein
MKKITLILLMAVCAFQAQAQNTISRLSTGAEVLYVRGSGFVYAIGGEYKYSTSKDVLAAAHTAGGNISIGASISDETAILVGGGYEYNVTYERGQPYAILRLNLGPVLLSGKVLKSAFSQYKNNIELNATVFPTKGIVGIKLLYYTEYNCTNFGAGIVFRFSSSGGSKKEKPCGICPGM